MPHSEKANEHEFVNEHIASRKDWVRYVELVTEVRRAVVREADEFLAQIRGRLDEALRRERRNAPRG